MTFRGMRRGPLESDTCADFVLPMLEAAGWENLQIVAEYPVKASRVVSSGGIQRELPSLPSQVSWTSWERIFPRCLQHLRLRTNCLPFGPHRAHLGSLVEIAAAFGGSAAFHAQVDDLQRRLHPA
jgi:hypothetical protein